MRRVLLITCMVAVVGILLVGCKEKSEIPKEAEKGEVQTPKKELSEEKALAGRKVVMIIAPQNFRDEEFLQPKKVLTEKGAVVTVACASLETTKGMLGAEVKPDILASEIKPEDWDAIILVGGTGATHYFEDSSVHSMLNEAMNQNKVVGAICIAPVTLANAGILAGKKATVSGSEADRLKEKGAEYTGKDVERDGKIITASGPQAAERFGNAIAQALME